MLFGHADIEEALRMGMTEKLQTCAIFHGGSNGTEGLIGVSGSAERPAKGIRERLCRSDLGVRDAGQVELGNAMVIAGVRLSGRIALALSSRHGAMSARAEHKQSGKCVPIPARRGRR